VLFVSHSVSAIQQLCTRAILLNQGTVMMDGLPQNVVSHYLSMGMDQVGERVWSNLREAPGDEFARLRAVRVLDGNRNICTTFDVRDPISLEMEYEVLQDRDWLEVALYFYNERGELLFASIDDVARSQAEEKRLAGHYSSLCHIPSDFLNTGAVYVLAALTAEKATHTIQRDVVSFNVNDSLDPNGVRGRSRGEWPAAAVRPKLQWTIEYAPLAGPEQSKRVSK